MANPPSLLSNDVVSSSNNITLRPFNPSDAKDLLSWATDNEVARYTPSWRTWASEQDSLDFIQNVAARHPFMRAVCLDNRPIGSVAVTPLRPEDAKCRAQLGYAVGPNYRNKGIATRAVKIAANEAFNKWAHLKRVEALVEVENVASQRVLHKAGFKKEGLLRQYLIMDGEATDLFIFSLLASDLLV